MAFRFPAVGPVNTLDTTDQERTAYRGVGVLSGRGDGKRICMILTHYD